MINLRLLPGQYAPPETVSSALNYQDWLNNCIEDEEVRKGIDQAVMDTIVYGHATVDVDKLIKDYLDRGDEK